MLRKKTEVGSEKILLMIEKVKWMAALILPAGIIYGSYKASRYVSVSQNMAQKAEVVIDVGHGGSRLRK